jgi:hypothetical protein
MEGTVRFGGWEEPFKPQTVLLRWSRAVGLGRDPPQAERARWRASIKRGVFWNGELARRLACRRAVFRRKWGGT